ncbi:hypothetical protein [Vibrio sp. 1180_3]|uniref:hypothetical protein n=1 Tax=Vibrio sp. 1180_3 TaxID=2528832 RepID=UPI0024073A08|nr:hypothetical protein [Vibrio sp. 1180_3]MDF9399072.1 hypothetical protein [Vibrio sp. 1180_3]
MAQAAEKISRKTQKTTSIPLQSKSSASRSTPSIMLDGYKNELANKLAKESIQCVSEISLTAEFFEEDHFVELIQLADSLGLGTDIDALFDSSDLENLTPFMTKLLNQIKCKVELDISEATAKITDDLFLTLVNNGINLDYISYQSMVKASSNSDFGTLEVGINNSTNPNFNCGIEFALNITAVDTACLELPERESELARTSTSALFELSDHALLIASTEAILDIIPDYYNILEYAGHKFDTTDDVEEIFTELVEQDYINDFGWANPMN